MTSGSVPSEQHWSRLLSSYDTVASAYETRFVDELDAKPRDRELLASFAARVTDPVVELGCGPGQVGAFLRNRRHVVGIDLSVEMTRLARRRLDGVAVADIRCLPLADMSVGGIVAFYSLIHLHRRELPAAFAEIARVLRPDAPLLVAVHEGEGEVTRDEFLGESVPFVATLYGLEELVDAARSVDLRVTLTERRGPYPDESGTTRLYLEAIRTEESGRKGGSR